MKSVEETDHYEVVPVRMVFRGVPVPELGRGVTAGERDSFGAKSVNYRGIRTFPDSISASQRRANARIRDVLRRVGIGDVSVIWDLLMESPEYICDPQIRKTFYQLAMNDRLRRRRGRPAEKYTLHPLIVAGLVDECVIQGLAMNKDEAFWLLSERIGYVSYEQIKNLYYQAIHEERFKAVLIQQSDSARPATPEELAMLKDAELLQPCGTVHRKIQDLNGNQVDVRFDAV